MAGIRDVASRAGVSVSTVSNVINDRHAKMSADTLQRVQKAITDLKYTPSVVARQLRSGTTRTLGLIVPSVANPFWGTVSQLVEKQALMRGYQVHICNAERDPDLEVNYMNSLYDSSIRGVILGSSPVSVDHLREHADKGMYIAALDRNSQGAHSVMSCSVSIDQMKGAKLATRHLIGLGHERIGFISGPIGTLSRMARLEGMRNEMAKANLTVDEDLIWTSSDAEGFGDSQAAELGRSAIQELLTLDRPPTAVFTVNDMYAIGALSGARELGFRVPEDLSLVGFDDIFMAELLQPPLTTVRQPVQKMSEMVVTKLVDALEGNTRLEDPYIELRPELIVRASAVPPNLSHHHFQA